MTDTAGVQRRLGEASGLQQNARLEAFGEILQQMLQDGHDLPSGLSLYLDTILQDNVGMVVSRPLLNKVVSRLGELNVDDARECYIVLLEKLRTRVVSFEEQDRLVRERLATIYEGHDDNSSAAAVLQGMTLESGQRQISDDYKLLVYIRILRNLLHDDQSVDADAYLNRATLLIHKTNDVNIITDFKFAQARIFDAKRRFLEACQKYHEISFAQHVDVDDRLRCLSASLYCAVLAAAGPARSRTLAILYKDDRAASLAEFGILEKVYFDRILVPEEVKAFSKGLKPHHTAVMSDGTTVFTRAVVEHNLLSVSRLYNNIGFAHLGSLLGLSPEQAEEYAARMIEQNRMHGLIDQIDQVIYFDATELAGRETLKWDAAITQVNESIEKAALLVAS